MERYNLHQRKKLLNYFSSSAVLPAYRHIPGYLFLDFFDSLLFGLPAFVQLFASAFMIGLLLTFFMIFRGFLFSQLHGTTRRTRIYRYNARA